MRFFDPFFQKYQRGLDQKLGFKEIPVEKKLHNHNINNIYPGLGIDVQHIRRAGTLAMEMKQRKLLFQVLLSENSQSEQEIYCCIMHHPLRTTMITPTLYPVDKIHIIYNGLLSEQYVYETQQEVWKILLSDDKTMENTETYIINIQAQWNKVVSYHAPIYDASESWDFVFSQTPINPHMYLDGYINLFDNLYASEADLLEEEERMNKIY